MINFFTLDSSINQFNNYNNIFIRVILDDNLEIKNELVDSSELVVIVNRNLQTDVFKDIEPVKISASYDGLSIYLSKQDYTFLLTLSQENFSETVEDKTIDKNGVIKDKDLIREEASKIAKSSTLPPVLHAINVETNVLGITFDLIFNVRKKLF